MGIKELRKKKGYTQEALARQIGISLRHYQNIEYGAVNPSIVIALKLAYALEIDPDEVFLYNKRDLDYHI